MSGEDRRLTVGVPTSNEGRDPQDRGLFLHAPRVGDDHVAAAQQAHEGIPCEGGEEHQLVRAGFFEGGPDLGVRVNRPEHRDAGPGGEAVQCPDQADEPIPEALASVERDQHMARLVLLGEWTPRHRRVVNRVARDGDQTLGPFDAAVASLKLRGAAVQGGQRGDPGPEPLLRERVVQVSRPHPGFEVADGEAKAVGRHGSGDRAGRVALHQYGVRPDVFEDADESGRIGFDLLRRVEWG